MATVKQTKALERLLTYCITQTHDNDEQQALELAKKKGYVNEDGKVTLTGADLLDYLDEVSAKS
jgi:purine nucleoside permease